VFSRWPTVLLRGTLQYLEKDTLGDEVFLEEYKRFTPHKDYKKAFIDDVAFNAQYGKSEMINVIRFILQERSGMTFTYSDGRVVHTGGEDE
jgi:hypothetical protein